MNRAPTVFISVGEFSGDILAGQLVSELKSQISNLHLFGITGPSLQNLNVKSIATIDDFNVMGIWEVIKKLSHLKLLKQKILREIEANSPDLAILVDFPGFHLDLAAELKMRGIKVVQYIAPKVWAWGAGRVKKLREDFDLVLGILPFEEEFFLKNAVNYKYVGNPHLERLEGIQINKSALGFKDDEPVVAFLPGSRQSEIEGLKKYLIPYSLALRDLNPKIKIIVPIAHSLDFERTTNSFREEGDIGQIQFFKGSSLELMKIADLGVIASGTATLECGLLGTPLCVIYKLNYLSYLVAKKFIKIKYASLVNLILEEGVAPEFLQNIEIPDLVSFTNKILNDPVYTENYRLKLDELKRRLVGGAAKEATRQIKDIL